MTTVVLNRRNLLAAGGAVLATGVSGLLLPARAQGLAPTATMSGGANNYRKGAPVVDRIGKLGPDPRGLAVWGVPSWGAVTEIARDLDGAEEPIRLVTASFYADFGQEQL